MLRFDFYSEKKICMLRIIWPWFYSFVSNSFKLKTKYSYNDNIKSQKSFAWRQNLVSSKNAKELHLIPQRVLSSQHWSRARRFGDIIGSLARDSSTRWPAARNDFRRFVLIPQRVRLLWSSDVDVMSPPSAVFAMRRSCWASVLSGVSYLRI